MLLSILRLPVAARLCSCSGGLVKLLGGPLRKSLFLLFLIYAANLPATTYYVAKTGSDSNDCGSSSPCATINHAVGLTNPGDTVVVERGIYAQTVTVKVS